MLEINDRFLPFLEKKARYKVAYGGRAGSKSHNFGAISLIQAAREPLLCACLREYQKNLEESVYRLLCNKIREDEVLREIYKIKSKEIIGENGSEFVFSGIKSAANFKSFEAADRAWIEEAQQISQESTQIVIPTIRKPGSEIWFSYNPDAEDDPVHKLMLDPFKIELDYLKKSGFSDKEIQELMSCYDVGQINLNINYYDNPHCPAIMKLEAKKMEQADYDLYRHIWLGETRQASDAIIFKDKFEVLDFEVEDYFGIPRMDGQVLDMFYGHDFGWVHPTATIEAFIYKGCIYINDEIVGKEMDLDTQTIRITSEFKYVTNKTIYGDNARPDLIDTLKYARLSKEGHQLPGLLIEPANKGAGSVESGITWLKSHKKIYIHPRCRNTVENFKKYCYKKDKNGIITTAIVKLNDDCIDALRYAFTPIIGEDTQGIDWNNPDFLTV